MSTEGTQFENRLIRAALDAANIGLLVVADDGNVVMMEGAVAHTLFAPVEIFIGQPYRRLFITGKLPHDGHELFSVHADEISTETTVELDGGKQTTLLFQARTVAKSNELDRYRVVSVIDLSRFGTTRSRAYELRRQLDALNSAVMLADARQPDMPIVGVSQRFEQLTGYPADSAFGGSHHFLQGDQKNGEAAGQLAEAIQFQQSCHVVVETVRKDGSSSLNEVFISPLFDAAGKLTHYVSVQQDCADRVVGPASKGVQK